MRCVLFLMSTFRLPGVLPGFQLRALNGRDFSKGPWVTETPGDQLLPVLPADAKVGGFFFLNFCLMGKL